MHALEVIIKRNADRVVKDFGRALLDGDRVDAARIATSNQDLIGPGDDDDERDEGGEA